MAIPESDEVSPSVKVLKALSGVHVQKLNPIIQDLDFIYSEVPNMTADQRKIKQNSVIRISNLLMPTNDYISYMKEDLYRNLEKEVELQIKSELQPPPAPQNLKELRDIALDPIPSWQKSIGVNTQEPTSYNTTQTLNFDPQQVNFKDSIRIRKPDSWASESRISRRKKSKSKNNPRSIARDAKVTQKPTPFESKRSPTWKSHEDFSASIHHNNSLDVEQNDEIFMAQKRF